MLNTVVLLTVVALVQSHDVKVGNNTEGRKIFDEVRHASPAIWRQTECITINTTDAEVISRVVITDLRPDKDGDVKILEGGEGQKNVTMELKSPTILRGYDFKIEVYAVPDNNSNEENVTTDEGQVRKQRNPEEFTKNDKPNLDLPQTIFEDAKKSVSNDTNVNEGGNKTADSSAEKVNNDQLTVTEDAAKTQQPRINVPINRTPSAASTTEKSRNKRETELKNTKTTQREEKVDYVNIPRFMDERNSTIFEQKPVISIQ